MTGILLLFSENPTAGDRDSEKFVNPDIKSVQINIDGVPNMLYSKGMLPTDQWESIKQRFPRSLESEVTETKFYTEDKFALSQNRFVIMLLVWWHFITRHRSG